MVGVRADADLRHPWQDERFDALILRHDLDEGVQAEFSDEIRDRHPDLPVNGRADPGEMGCFLAGVLEELEV